MANLVNSVGGVHQTRRILRDRGSNLFYSVQHKLYLSKREDGAIDLKELEIEYFHRECISLDHRVFYLTVFVAISLVYIFAIFVQQSLSGNFPSGLFVILLLLSFALVLASFAIDHLRMGFKYHAK